LQANELSLQTNSVIQGVSYAVVTIGLTAITLSVAYIWNRKVEKDEEIKIQGQTLFKPSNVVEGSHISLQSVDLHRTSGFQPIGEMTRIVV
jgi:predicted small secreted protein